MKLNPEEPQASPYSATSKYSYGDDVHRHSVTVLVTHRQATASSNNNVPHSVGLRVECEEIWRKSENKRLKIKKPTGGISSIFSHKTRTMLNNQNDDDNNNAVATTNNGCTNIKFQLYALKLLIPRMIIIISIAHQQTSHTQ